MKPIPDLATTITPARGKALSALKRKTFFLNGGRWKCRGLPAIDTMVADALVNEDLAVNTPFQNKAHFGNRLTITPRGRALLRLVQEERA